MTGVVMEAVAELRAAERAYQEHGDEHALERARALVEGELGGEPYAAEFRRWLLLLRYDRHGDDRDLDEVVRAGAGRLGVAAALRRTARDGDVTHLDRAIATEPPEVSGQGFLWQTGEWQALDLGRAHLERYRLTGSEGDLSDAGRIARTASGTAGDPFVRAACLALLAACEQEIYLLGGGRPMLDRAIRGYEDALGLLAPGALPRPMILTELGTALQDRFTEDEDPADIERAVALADEAARTVPHGPDAACHLVNLGTALQGRYEHDGDPRDLDRALRCWRDALDALPAGSPYRPAFLDRLALGHLTRAESGDRAEDDLDIAIELGRAAVREGAGANDAAVYANHLSDALEERWEVHRDPADLHEAVRVLGEVVDERGARAPALIANLAQVLLSRFQVLGDPADIDRAIEWLGRLARRTLPPGHRTGIEASLARALSMRYQMLGRPADLAAAIAAARRGLAGVHPRSMPWSSRVTRLAQLLHMRYRRDGRRRDLDRAIGLMREVVEVAAGQDQEIASDQLTHLAVFLMERYEHDGDPAAHEEAVALAGRAVDLDHRDHAPHLMSNAAAAIHDRFVLDGSFDDLDAAIERHREAANAELPTVLGYPKLLSNLGLALQDRYLYRDDHAALDEAVDVHERAVAASPEQAPDRPGLMSTLAAALLLRYERDTRPADLDRVIDLYERGLAMLGPSAPERTSLLGSLAAALRLRARAGGDRAEFGRSVELLRSALRRTRPAQPIRPGLLLDYAEALAERHDRFPGGDRAAVLRALRNAVEASEGAAVLRLEAARALGTWALEHRLWQPAADAFRLADRARRALFVAQRAHDHGDAWLKQGEDLNAAEAYARVRLGALRDAVAALDGGRALRLSATLDGRMLADRLRAGGHHDLADRYERAADRMRRENALARPAG
ncbi:tetratricopeptide repeat protein [Actinomadura formosensis]|nr:tetratricopeptide repeat protein [Actinomadura formosensis]